MTDGWIAVVGSGEIDSGNFGEIRRADAVIAADRAAFVLLNEGITPQVAVGDFDSVVAEEMERIEDSVKDIRRVEKEKDDTDMELALDVAQSYGKGEIRLFGALGKRFDHALGNVGLLERCLHRGIPAEIVDPLVRIRMTDVGMDLEGNPAYGYLSVIPVTETAIVTLVGVRYPVNRRRFERTDTLGVSNEIVASPAHLTVDEGTVLVIRARDGKVRL